MVLRYEPFVEGRRFRVVTGLRFHQTFVVEVGKGPSRFLVLRVNTEHGEIGGSRFIERTPNFLPRMRA